MLRGDIINREIKKNKFHTYLEVGYQNGYNFDMINCKNKVAVDPNPNKVCPELIVKTSDDFFSENKMDFDIIFIDGSHLCEQVTKDIVNASKCLSKNGCIILHDVLPQEESNQTREIGSGAYCGDVWRSVMGLVSHYPEIDITTYNTDWGVSVIYPNGTIYKGEFQEVTMRFDEFMANRDLILNVK